MTREQLEHVLRAAATVADDDDLVVIGSQAILGQYPDAPAELLMSDEDRRFVVAALRAGLVDEATLRARLEDTAIDPEALARETADRLARWASAARNA